MDWRENTDDWNGGVDMRAMLTVMAWREADRQEDMRELTA